MRAEASSAFPYRQRDFEAQVQLFKQLAQSAWNEPLETEADIQAQNIARFRKLGKLIEKGISSFKGAKADNPDPETEDRMAVSLISMYLYDKTLEIHDAVMKESKIGLFSLYDSLRESIYSLISGYESKSLPDFVAEYMEHEPRLVACAELTGVEVLPIQEAVALYEPKLRKAK